MTGTKDLIFIELLKELSFKISYNTEYQINKRIFFFENFVTRRIDWLRWHKFVTIPITAA